MPACLQQLRCSLHTMAAGERLTQEDTICHCQPHRPSLLQEKRPTKAERYPWCWSPTNTFPPVLLQTKKPTKAQKRKQQQAQREAEREARIAAEQAESGPSQREQEAEQLQAMLEPLGLVMREIQVSPPVKDGQRPSLAIELEGLVVWNLRGDLSVEDGLRSHVAWQEQCISTSCIPLSASQHTQSLSSVKRFCVVLRRDEPSAQDCLLVSLAALSTMLCARCFHWQLARVSETDQHDAVYAEACSCSSDDQEA